MYQNIKFEERESVELSHGGQKIFGIIHRPLSKEKVPAILICHGFAGNKSGKFRLYVRLAECLSKIGIATLRIDFRGSGDSEGDFSEMSLERETEDALEALKFLEKDERIDSNKIGILGRSLGGIISVIAARRYGKIKSLALWAPAFHAEQWREKLTTVTDPRITEIERDQLMRFEGSLASESFIQQFFSLCLEDELKELESVPLLHIHGEKDYSVDTTHAECYEKGREGARGETRMIRLPHSDHEFANIQEQDFTIDETCKWFRRTLGF